VSFFDAADVAAKMKLGDGRADLAGELFEKTAALLDQ
jgi:hypothetical protein